MSNCDFLSLRPEVRHGASGCEEEGNVDPEANVNNPAKRRRGEHLIVNSRCAERMTPWRKSTPYSSGVVGLHEEVQDFYQFMSPLTEEKEMRKDLVNRVSAVISSQWPNAKVEVFGSFRTGLFLPTSDIDIVVFGNWTSLPLHTLGDLLVTAEISVADDIKLIESARVPIVKLCDKRSGIKVDISFNMTTGVSSALMIKDYIKQYPVMPKLVMILKQFLLQRDLNEVFTGGISSYSLILLVVSFLQLHCRASADSEEANIGVLLIEFFELYGRNFSYDKNGIRIADGGSYFNKRDIADDHALANPSYLTIEDPLDETNDISRASWGAMKVKTAFEHAHSVLVGAVLSRDPPNIQGNSILGRIIRAGDELVEFRRKAIHKWTGSTSSSSAPSSSVATVGNDAGGFSRTRARTGSPPVSLSSEAQPTGSQLTYAAAASIGRTETAAGGSKLVRSSSLSSSRRADGDTDSLAKSSSLRSRCSSASSGSGMDCPGDSSGPGGLAKPTARSKHSNPAARHQARHQHSTTSSSADEDEGSRTETAISTARPSSRHKLLRSCQDNSKGSRGRSHSPPGTEST